MGVIYKPETKHVCAPGWTPRTDGFGIPALNDTYPVGTVWECDACGTRWVSKGVWTPSVRQVGGYMAGVVEWKREGWLSRWLRK